MLNLGHGFGGVDWDYANLWFTVNNSWPIPNRRGCAFVNNLLPYRNTPLFRGI